MKTTSGGSDDEERAVLSNAKRLISDAKLLRRHRRLPSSFALATLAVEELGKVLLRRWATMSGQALPTANSAHVRKQLAVSSIVAAQSANSEMSRHPSGSAEELFQRFADHLVDSEAGLHLLHASLGIFERAKHMALYRDEDRLLGLSSSDLDDEDIDRQLDAYSAGLLCLSSPSAMRLGRVLYCVNLSGQDHLLGLKSTLDGRNR